MLAAIAAILAADLITGFGHWIEDNYCPPGKTGWLAENVCGPNLRHHVDQLAMLAGGFWYRNWTAFAFAWPLALLAFVIGLPVWLCVAFVLSGFGNEVHSWAHRRPTSRVARFLIDAAITITPQNHAKHHRAPFDRCYCTLTNVLNPILDGLRVWRGLEAIVTATTGRKPNHVDSTRH